MDGGQNRGILIACHKAIIKSPEKAPFLCGEIGPNVSLWFAPMEKALAAQISRLILASLKPPGRNETVWDLDKRRVRKRLRKRMKMRKRSNRPFSGSVL